MIMGGPVSLSATFAQHIGRIVMRSFLFPFEPSPQRAATDGAPLVTLDHREVTGNAPSEDGSPKEQLPLPGLQEMVTVLILC